MANSYPYRESVISPHSPANAILFDAHSGFLWTQLSNNPPLVYLTVFKKSILIKFLVLLPMSQALDPGLQWNSLSLSIWWRSLFLNSSIRYPQNFLCFKKSNSNFFNLVFPGSSVFFFFGSPPSLSAALWTGHGTLRQCFIGVCCDFLLLYSMPLLNNARYPRRW